MATFRRPGRRNSQAAAALLGLSKRVVAGKRTRNSTVWRRKPLGRRMGGGYRRGVKCLEHIGVAFRYGCSDATTHCGNHPAFHGGIACSAAGFCRLADLPRASRSRVRLALSLPSAERRPFRLLCANWCCADLVEACPQLRSHALADNVVYGINASHTFPNGKKKRSTLPLARRAWLTRVIGLPTSFTAAKSTASCRLRSEDVHDRAQQIPAADFR